ncbi:MAG: trimeric intracellular cation channel family protein [Rhodobacteraceae bacterium]|nr:trimeric intracellular cation channel family protein [Paracoccaceae bacterium]
MTLLDLLDYASVFVFALTGSLAASRAQLDIVGFAFLASLTAVGGGTVRDVLLDRNPVFWIAEPTYIGVAVAAAALVFFTAHIFESRLKVLTWLDACALSVAVPAGTGVALLFHEHPAVVLLMGVATGCLGGLMRDVVGNEVPLVLKQGELYVTAAFIGSGAALVAFQFLPAGFALLIGAVVTFILRAGSLIFGWRLPVYKSRPPRR